jgi:hypothetical protein
MAAPVFDAQGLSAYQGNIQNSLTLTWTHVVGTNPNNYGLVTIFEGNGGNADLMPSSVTSSSVSIGSTTLSSLGYVLMNNSQADGFIWVFGAPNCPTGSQTVTMTLNFSGIFWVWGYGYSTTYTGVGSVGSLQTAYGSGTANSVTVPSASGHLVYGAMENYSTDTYSGLSFTARETQTSNQPYFIAGDMAGTSSTSFSATLSGSLPWGAVGLDLQPVSAPINQFFSMFR